jgi:uncharacterized membrane protein
MSSRKVILILLGIILIAGCLRLYGLDRHSLWYDEVAEEKGFQLQFLGWKDGVIPDTPPLHSFFIYPAVRLFPRNDFVLRLVPFIFGLISIPLLFLLGKSLFNVKVGLIVSFLLAISPFHIWYSQEARMYAFQWMLAIISLLYFFQALERPNRGNFLGYIISTEAGLYTNQLSVFLIILQSLYILFFFRRYQHQFIRWFGVFIIIIILYLPWIIHMFFSLQNRNMGYAKEFDIKSIFYTILVYSSGFSIGPSIRELHLDRSFAVIKPYLHLITFLMSIYTFLFILGLWSVKKSPSKFIILLLLFTVPIGGVIILSKLPNLNITYNVRYTGIAFFGFLLTIAKGVDFLDNIKYQLIGRKLFIFSLIVITIFSFYSYANYQFDIKYAKPDIRAAVTYIKNNRTSDDGILCIVDAPTFNRYSIFYGFYCSTFSPLVNQNNREEIEAALSDIVRRKNRLWLVLSHEWVQPNFTKYSLTWLDNNFSEIIQLQKGINEIANLRIFCYDLKKKKHYQDKVM